MNVLLTRKYGSSLKLFQQIFKNLNKAKKVNSSFSTCCKHPRVNRLLIKVGVRHISTDMAPVFTVSPKGHLLVDDKLHIKLTGLPKEKKVTVYGFLEEEGKKFESNAWFETKSDGTVDLQIDPSTGGTYTGVSPMGIFWSMVACPGQLEGIRMMKKNMDTPFRTSVSVHDGHLNLGEVRVNSDGALGSTLIDRYYKAPGVRVEEVTDGRLRGKLYLPPGPGPHSGVIDLFGTVGGIVEFRSALLASRGIASFALPYFLYKDLPQALEDLDLDYFMEAIDWLLGRRDIIPGGVGVIGVSKGGDIALMMGTYSPKVKCAVNINGCPIAAMYDMKYKSRGETIKAVPFNMDGLKYEDDKVIMKGSLDIKTEDILPVWTSDVKTLHVLGEDDLCYPTVECIKCLQSLYPRDKAHNCEVLSYPRAGHLIEPPYTPLCSVSYHKTFNLHFLWGGHPEEHAKAQEESWSRILNLFRTELVCSSQHNARL
ncbi:acyl-coenzyme A amino acid N-acyltransferase 1-like isoform X1 [Mya arenaria]|uniref:acyl-coenzyme A amino acid N-acyltransferase 1-like isoform X1 n=1 Tax=Mya arenaria TaxID=6604 RepID=UPI0022E31AEE|nr:acyl-coenzyme A amino acid N-acyltransferase 1-like isoform X1 [Mya arenaria]